MRLDCGDCFLRPYSADDLASLVKHINNRNVWINLRDRLPHPYTLSDGRAWLEHVATQESVTDLAIAVQNEVVGGIGLVLNDDVERGTAELGYWLGENFWGQGLTTAAIQTLVPWAFATFNLRRIYALPFAHNLASRRVLEKANFHLEGILRQHVIKAGQVHDQAVYARLRDPV